MHTAAEVRSDERARSRLPVLRLCSVLRHWWFNGYGDAVVIGLLLRLAVGMTFAVGLIYLFVSGG